MAAIPPVPYMSALPPLPYGWSQHVAPGGQLYYFNALTKHSTYSRPPPAPFVPSSAPRKHRRFIEKLPLGETAWVRVRTWEGVVFYWERERGVSVWDVPGECAEVVLGVEEREREERAAREGRKRKMEEGDEEGEEGGREAKRARGEDGEEEEEESEVDEEEAQRIEEEAEAARAKWEKEEEEKRLREEQAELERVKREARAKADADARIAAIAPPNMTTDEAKALFRTLLEDLRISPLAPYEDSLPMLVPDPRYALLPSAADRLAVFNDYCRAQAHKRSSAAAAKEGTKLGPEEEYMKLLREDVLSTRTSWTEWRRKWKKERRFWGWGTEREREARFREYVRVLGERKRADKEQAEKNFRQLLEEHTASLPITPSSAWTDVKRHLSSDPRYDAVGSSSLRDELFTAYVASLASRPAPSLPAAQDEKPPKHESKLERQQRALREREEQVRREKGRVEREVERSRGAVSLEEGEREFGSLLVDAVRDLDTTWESALSTLRTDPRFTHSPLPPTRQRALFAAHLSQLESKHLAALHTLFLAHAPALNTPFAALPATLITSLPAQKLGLSPRTLEARYNAWQAQRYTDARAAFDALLRENAFVRFWGQARKLASSATALAPGILEDSVGYGDEEEAVDEQADGVGGGLAKRAEEVGLREVEMVLQGDARWRAFEHVPREREEWLRGYLEGLSAPGMSVHVE